MYQGEQMKPGYGFYDKDNKHYLIRCYDCKLENHASMVATGKCAWCGSVKKTPKKKAK